MNISVIVRVFKEAPEVLHLREVWTIGEAELSSEMRETLGLLDHELLHGVGQQVAWLCQAVLEFQDLQRLLLPRKGKFFNTNYFFYQGLATLREAVLCGLAGQYHASLAALRSTLEAHVAHHWWRIRLQDEEDFDRFYDVLEGRAGPTPFKNAAEFILNENPPSLDGWTLEAVQELYSRLCSYSHKALLHESFGPRQTDTPAVERVPALGVWLGGLRDTLCCLVDLAIAQDPQSLFPIEIHRKFGFNPPVGVFFDASNILALKKILGAERLGRYRDHFRSRQSVVDLMRFAESRPDLTNDEVLRSWPPRAEVPKDLPHDDLVLIGMAHVKAEMRALNWANAYSGVEARIEALGSDGIAVSGPDGPPSGPPAQKTG